MKSGYFYFIDEKYFDDFQNIELMQKQRKE